MTAELSFDSAEATIEWATSAPGELVSRVAMRTGLRALPAIGFEPTEELEAFALHVFRAALSGYVLANAQTAELAGATRASIISARDRLIEIASADAAAASSALAVNWAADTVLHVFRGSGKHGHRIGEALRYAKDAAAHSARIVTVAGGGSEISQRIDVAVLSSHRLIEAEMSEDAQKGPGSPPLWCAERMPLGLEEGYKQLSQKLDADRATWGFWLDWFRAVHEGRTLDHKLLHLVAAIPDGEWEKGASRIAVVIAELKARLELRRRIGDLEAEFPHAGMSRYGIGGNNPPEAISDAPSLPRELTAAFEPVQTLKEQVEREDPDPEAVEGAIARLTGLIVACGRWAGGKVEAAATEYAKAIGKWGGTATTVWIAAQQPQIEAVIRAAQDWLVKLLS